MCMRKSLLSQRATLEPLDQGRQGMPPTHAITGRSRKSSGNQCDLVALKIGRTADGGRQPLLQRLGESQGMDVICAYAERPLAFFGRYIRLRPVSHALILLCVVAAVTCSVSTQYGVKFLVDTLSGRGGGAGNVWLAFALLVSLITADNLLWRLASWIASYAFVAVSGDLRNDLFRHLTGHAPSYFAERLPGMLTSRITATSNAVFTVENMFVSNVLPPCIATAGSIAFHATVSWHRAGGRTPLAAILVFAMFRLAAAGRPLHHDFADKAAKVDGEMIDVVANMPLVRAFGGLGREFRRFRETVGREMGARRRSLLYLEKVRLFHAVITIVLTIGLLAWVIVL